MAWPEAEHEPARHEPMAQHGLAIIYIFLIYFFIDLLFLKMTRPSEEYNFEFCLNDYSIHANLEGLEHGIEVESNIALCQTNSLKKKNEEN